MKVWSLAIVLVPLGACAVQQADQEPTVDPVKMQAVLDAAEARAEAQREAETLYAEAEALAGKDPERAIELYRQATRLWPTWGEAWNNLGVLLMEREEYHGARDALLLAADRTPRDPRPLQNLGKMMMDIGWPEDAYDFFREALERDPFHTKSLRGITAAADAVQRADEETLEYIRRALLQTQPAEWREYLERQRLRVEQELAY